MKNEKLSLINKSTKNESKNKTKDTKLNTYNQSELSPIEEVSSKVSVVC
jgi:hypothetical protein